MKIFILGHKGFVGSGISDYFTSKGVEFEGIDRSNYGSLVGKECDLFINVAGSSKKRLATTDPKIDFAANVVDTANSIFDFKAKKYVYLSTIDVYNNVSSKPKEITIIEPLKLSNYGFDKYFAEQIVRKYCPSWIIVRAAGMVGRNMSKNAVFDILNFGKTFVSPKSEYQYMNTLDLGRILHQLSEKTENDIFNVCGDGAIAVEEIAKIAGVTLPKECYKLPAEKYEVDVSKASKYCKIPKTRDTIIDFMKNR